MLESKRCLYVPWEKEDFELLKQILGNPKVCQYLPGQDQKSDKEIQAWLNFYVQSFNDKDGNKIFKIMDKESQQVIGYGGLGYVKEFKEIEIMYGFNEDYWGQGYGTEVSLWMKDYAKELGLDFVIALADTKNIGSNRVLEKTGFEKIKQIHLWGLDLFYYEMKL